MQNNQLRIVILNSPYDNYHNDEAMQLFNSTIKLKIEGYLKEYPYGVLPFCDADLVSNHLLICEETKDGKLNPITGMKSITLEKCLKHRIAFPLLQILNGSKLGTGARQEVERVIATHIGDKAQADLAYNGSFTIHPIVRKNKELTKYLWDLLSTILTRYYNEPKLKHVTAICAKKFKIDRYKQMLGWDYLKNNEGTISEFDCFSLMGETFYIMHAYGPSQAALEIAKQRSKEWDNRLIIGSSDTLEFLKDVA